MKNYVNVVNAFSHCIKKIGCDGCPYKGSECINRLMVDACKCMEEMEAKLKTPKNAGSECTAMPNYEVEYNRLHCENAELHIQINEMREELIFLRAVKAAAEAFLGREIR